MNAPLPDDVRMFLESLAKPRSEPLNSVVGYPTRQARDTLAVELRSGARDLLAKYAAKADTLDAGLDGDGG